MKKCEEFAPLLSAFVDGELTEEMLQEMEQTDLSPSACLSKNSKGRLKEEVQCDIRTVFQRDRDRILHCKSFRRLKDKTQVFLTPDGDHY